MSENAGCSPTRLLEISEQKKTNREWVYCVYRRYLFHRVLPLPLVLNRSYNSYSIPEMFVFKTRECFFTHLFFVFVN